MYSCMHACMHTYTRIHTQIKVKEHIQHGERATQHHIPLVYSHACIHIFIHTHAYTDESKRNTFITVKEYDSTYLLYTAMHTYIRIYIHRSK